MPLSTYDKHEVILCVNELRKNRKVPQLLFSAPIYPDSMIKVRNAIIEFKKTGNNMDEVDFVINSPGGSPADGYRIIRTLRSNFEIVNIRLNSGFKLLSIESANQKELTDPVFSDYTSTRRSQGNKADVLETGPDAPAAKAVAGSAPAARQKHSIVFTWTS